MEVVLCKPDALSGPHSEVAVGTARAFLLSLGRVCEGGDFSELSGLFFRAARNAATQVSERAATESSFCGVLVHPLDCAADLRASAGHLVDRRIGTATILRLALAGLGFRVDAVRRHTCSDEDVQAIYPPQAKTGVAGALLNYLSGHEIEVWWLSGHQDPCALQWWKIYARHFLKRHPANGRHLLRNLVHVCDRPERVI